ncbi:MAG: UbiA family prenyltransferase, partial [Actinocatenispora sp.]
VPLSLLSGPVVGGTHLVAVAAGWLYNRPLKATPFSVLPYLVAFGLLPAFVVLGLPGQPAPPWWLCTAGALLGAGAHFFNALPDLADDRAAGIRGLPHRLGARASLASGGLLLFAASLVLAFGPAGGPTRSGLAGVAVAALALLGGTITARRAGSRAAFRTVLLVAVVDVALLMLAGTALRGR